jgi:hypothetical protein
MTMATSPLESKTDPRHLRALFNRATALSSEHQVASVFIGMAGREGDLLVRDFIDFVEAELRMEDGVFRLLRERAVLLLTDVSETQARAIMERLCADFGAQFPSIDGLNVAIAYAPVDPGAAPTAKEVLPGLFAAAPQRRH